jgi:hypothetical protein
MWRSPELAEAVERLEAELDQAWAQMLDDMGVAPRTPDEAALAWLIVNDPSAYAWRVVDAAQDCLTCQECGTGLARGTCDQCVFYDRMRFGAAEVDRPDIPRGNEHAIRVAFAVARNRERYAPRARAGYEMLLPALVGGALPTTSQAQSAKALINKLTPEECDRVTSMAEVERLARGR